VGAEGNELHSDTFLFSLFPAFVIGPYPRGLPARE